MRTPEGLIRIFAGSATAAEIILRNPLHLQNPVAKLAIGAGASLIALAAVGAAQWLRNPFGVKHRHI